MTPSYFNSEDRLQQLRDVVELLRGTPFFANSEAPGRDGGIDCVHTLNYLYRYCGAIGMLTIPRQRMDHSEHSERSLLIEAFETWPELRRRFTLIWRREGEPDNDPLIEVKEALLPGDALCLINGHVPHHGGVMLEHGWFMHTLKRDGVHTMRLDAVVRSQHLLGRLGAVYRPHP